MSLGIISLYRRYAMTFCHSLEPKIRTAVWVELEKVLKFNRIDVLMYHFSLETTVQWLCCLCIIAECFMLVAHVPSTVDALAWRYGILVFNSFEIADAELSTCETSRHFYSVTPIICVLGGIMPWRELQFGLHKFCHFLHLLPYPCRILQ